HVLQGYPPAMGGTEEAFEHISEELAGQFGDEVIVFTTNCYGGDAFNSPGLLCIPAGETNVKGVRVVRFPVMSWLSWLLKIPQDLAYHLKLPFNQYLRTLYQGPIVAGLGRAIRQSDADLVVASSFPLLHMYTALKAAKRSGKPIILVGGLHPEDVWSFDRLMIAKALTAADGCIAYTEYEAGQLERMGVERRRIWTIGLGVDAEIFKYADQQDAKVKLGLDKGPVVGFIGQVSAHKGVDLLLAAMEDVWAVVPDAQLLIAGARRPFAEKIEGTVSGWPEAFKKKIVLHYDFKEDEKTALYAALDIFVYPSQFESFGIAFLEAWSAHKPVIGLRRGAIPWVVDNEINGLLVEAQDVGALGKAIISLLKDPQRASMLAEKGFQKVLSQYNWHETGKRFREAYVSAIKGG
ncbi:MAG: glycosyltransferase family 4 protein, partial [Chloroflexota bacterium]